MKKKEIIQKLSFGYKLVEMVTPLGSLYFVSKSKSYTYQSIIKKSKFDMLLGLCNRNQIEQPFSWLRDEPTYKYYWIEK